MQVIILSGGKGTRLKPFTNVIPKPLIPIGDMPILEVVLRQLRYYGFSKVTLALSHMAHLFEAYFGDGSKFGMDVSYSIEDKVLGTAGPLRLLSNVPDTFLVMNGDVLTTLNYSDLVRFHVEGKYDATIATFNKEVTIDLGVLRVDGATFLDYVEKPTFNYKVSMGIYVFSRKVIDLIPKDIKHDMPELMLSLRDVGMAIGCYCGSYEWLDIGRLEDYEKAIELFETQRSRYLPE
jgi:NDP-sugar pyrophosphorylase family protein